MNSESDVFFPAYFKWPGLTAQDTTAKEELAQKLGTRSHFAQSTAMKGKMQIYMARRLKSMMEAKNTTKYGLFFYLRRIVCGMTHSCRCTFMRARRELAN